MPSLTETQSPFLERDAKSGLLPGKLPGDSEAEYIARLKILYFASEEAVLRVLNR